MIKRLLITFILMLTLHTAAWADKDNITLNFANTDVVSVIKAVGMITGKNFLIDPRVKGTVNIVSSKPVSRAMIYPILLSALRLQGYAAVESHGLIKIVPEADAKLNGAQIVGMNIPVSGEVVTQVFALKHQSAAQLVPVLRPLISPNNTITYYPNSNSLVITDYADNLKHIDRIIDAIDQPSDDSTVIRLQHASALDIAQTLHRLITDNNGGATPDPHDHVSIAVDAHSNSIVLDSVSAARVAMLQHLIEKLDQPTGDMDNIHVIYLKNADATRLAQTLNAAMTGESITPTPSTPLKINSSTTSTASGAAGGSTSNTPSMSPPTPSPLGNSASPTNATGGLSSSGAASGNSGNGGGGAIIQADAATNSLVLVAPEAVYNNIRAVVDKLDERRAQIFVEALIVEVDANKAAQFGIQWQNLSGINKSGNQLFGGTNFGTPAGGSNILSAASNITSVGQGLNIGIINGQVNIPGVGQVLNLGALAQALEIDDNANILSTPNLVTLDNQEAKIVVGQNIPLITGSYAQTGSTATITPFQTYNRTDVGLTLQIKPQISQGGSIQLQIYQEVSSVDTTTLNNPSGPTTNLRSIESTVLVDNGQIIVLGGLMQNSVSDSIAKVPGLGDLPILGNLFSYKSRSRTKTDLMVFLLPHVLRTADDYAGLTSDRYNYISGVQSRSQMANEALLPTYKAPLLPPLAPNDHVPH